MPITFGYIHNTRTEEVMFDIMDMEYPYNAIIGRGTLNVFKAVLDLAYLLSHPDLRDKAGCVSYVRQERTTHIIT
jgi:hypothetical protein